MCLLFVVALSDSLSVPDGGFSMDTETGQNILEGYAVSIYPECGRIIEGPVSPAEILRYILDMRDYLTTGVLGGWRDPESGKAFLDVSVVSCDRANAVRLARRHRQRAIYDFETQRSIPIRTVYGKRQVS